jgi:serine/threonine protein kinase
MPPELLVAGKLTPAADVYSFGIMMWEMVSRMPPFHGLHHGEIIHKVVTQDLRPGEGGMNLAGRLQRRDPSQRACRCHAACVCAVVNNLSFCWFQPAV